MLSNYEQIKESIFLGVKKIKLLHGDPDDGIGAKTYCMYLVFARRDHLVSSELLVWERCKLRMCNDADGGMGAKKKCLTLTQVINEWQRDQ